MSSHRTRFVCLIVVAGTAFMSASCSGSADVESDEDEAAQAVPAELSASPVIGRVVAYATTNGSNAGAKLSLGPGVYDGYDPAPIREAVRATRLLEVGPSMEARVCWSGTNPFACASYTNQTGANRTYSVSSNPTHIAVRPLVVAFRDPNYSGISQAFRVGRYDSIAKIQTIGNDTISSIRMAPGLTARLCSDDPERTVGGTCVTFTGSSAQLPSSIDNSTSWIEIRPAAVVYRDFNFSGISQRFGSGRFPVSFLGTVGNDTISSVLVSPGVWARLCSDDPFATVGGTCVTYHQSETAMDSSINNRTSWLETRHTVILSPLNEEFVQGTITLRGYATTPTEGELPGSRMRWVSLIDGVLGTGRTLQYTPSVPTTCNDVIAHSIALFQEAEDGSFIPSEQRTFYTYRFC